MKTGTTGLIPNSYWTHRLGLDSQTWTGLRPDSDTPQLLRRSVQEHCGPGNSTPAETYSFPDQGSGFGTRWEQHSEYRGAPWVRCVLDLYKGVIIEAGRPPGFQVLFVPVGVL